MLALGTLALPAQGEECFSGRPVQLSYDDGHQITIIQRNGDDVTFTQPYEGGTDAVQKTSLMLFPKTARFGARAIEYRWTSRLPKLVDLQPGTRFDLQGTMRSGKDAEMDYRVEGGVLGMAEVRLGDCAYPVLVIEMNTYMNGDLVIQASYHFSPDLTAVLQAQTLVLGTGRKTSYSVTAIR